MSEINSSTSTSSVDAFSKRVLQHLKPWPAWLMKALKDPQGAIAELPAQGSLERPVILAGTSGCLTALVLGIFTLLVAPLMVIEVIVFGIAGSIMSVFIASFVGNLIIGALGKEPGFYRCLMFSASWSIVWPTAALLGHYFSMLMILPSLLFLYQLYYFMLKAGEVAPQKAKTVVGILALMSLMSGMGHRHFIWF